MAVPKKRTSKSRKGMRRSHDKLENKHAIVECETCGEAKLMHRVCDACGTFRGNQILSVASEDQ